MAVRGINYTQKKNGKVKNYESVTIRLHDGKELVFNTGDFVKDWFDAVKFVLTGGLDVEQMYEYVRCMKKAGLNTLKFHFNTGRNPDIDKFLVWAKSHLENDVEVYERLSL